MDTKKMTGGPTPVNKTNLSTTKGSESIEIIMLNGEKVNMLIPEKVSFQKENYFRIVDVQPYLFSTDLYELVIDTNFLPEDIHQIITGSGYRVIEIVSNESGTVTVTVGV